jgi:hypothetical protein
MTLQPVQHSDVIGLAIEGSTVSEIYYVEDGSIPSADIPLNSSTYKLVLADGEVVYRTGAELRHAVRSFLFLTGCMEDPACEQSPTFQLICGEDIDQKFTVCDAHLPAMIRSCCGADKACVKAL